MNELIHIGNADISIKEYKGQRVVTFKDIDMVHERPDGTARKRFSDNRKHFVEGEDYFVLKPSDLENTELSEKRTLENVVMSNFGTALITEQGYLIAVSKENKVVCCEEISCIDCIFDKMTGNCSKLNKEWAEKEYEEPPVD